ncbi:hypothetical protein JOM56_008975 [Amanita muscaria]
MAQLSAALAEAERRLEDLSRPSDMDSKTTTPAMFQNATIDKAEKNEFNRLGTYCVSLENNVLEESGSPALQAPLTPLDVDYISVPATISPTLPRELVERTLLLLDTKSLLVSLTTHNHRFLTPNASSSSLSPSKREREQGNDRETEKDRGREKPPALSSSAFSGSTEGPSGFDVWLTSAWWSKESATSIGIVRDRLNRAVEGLVEHCHLLKLHLQPSAWSKPADAQLSKEEAGGTVFGLPQDTIETTGKVLQGLEATPSNAASA